MTSSIVASLFGMPLTSVCYYWLAHHKASKSPRFWAIDIGSYIHTTSMYNSPAPRCIFPCWDRLRATDAAAVCRRPLFAFWYSDDNNSRPHTIRSSPGKASPCNKLNRVGICECSVIPRISATCVHMYMNIIRNVCFGWWHEIDCGTSINGHHDNIVLITFLAFINFVEQIANVCIFIYFGLFASSACILIA